MLAFIKRRTFLVLIGLLILALLIWFAGPYFAFADYRPLESVLARVFVKESDPIPPEERLDPDAITEEVARRGIASTTIDGVEAIRDYLVTSARSGDVIVIMSNGAFGGLPRLVATALAA